MQAKPGLKSFNTGAHVTELCRKEGFSQLSWSERFKMLLQRANGKRVAARRARRAQSR